MFYICFISSYVKWVPVAMTGYIMKLQLKEVVSKRWLQICWISSQNWQGVDIQLLGTQPIIIDALDETAASWVSHMQYHKELNLKLWWPNIVSWAWPQVNNMTNCKDTPKSWFKVCCYSFVVPFIDPYT